MDFRSVVSKHVEAGADITIATLPVDRRNAQSLGIVQVSADRRITRFVEKPKEDPLLDSLRLTPETLARLEVQGGGEFFLASMGIYVFNRKLICELLGCAVDMCVVHLQRAHPH